LRCMIPQPQHKVESAGLKIEFMKPEKYKKLLLLFLAGMLSLHVVVAWRSRDLVRKGYPDFTALYSAGKIVREGLGRQLYDTQSQFRIQQGFASGVSIRQGPLPYIHPPWEALIFVPLTWFSYPVAYLLWDVVNVLILQSLPFLLRNQLPQLKQVSVLFWLFTALAFYPVFFDLLQGQDILPLLLFITLAFVSLKQNNDLAAGCWLGLGLFRFHLVLPLVFILLLHKRLKALIGFVLIAFVLALISIAIVGWNGVLSYPAFVWHIETVMGHGAIVPVDMPNLRGLLHTFLAARSSKLVIQLVVAGLSIASLFFASSKCKVAREGTAFDLGFALALVTTILVSYHANTYDLSLLFLPVMLLANHLAGAESKNEWNRIALVGPMLLLFVSPIQMLLLQKYGKLSLLAPVLLLWAWGLASEISRIGRPRGVPMTQAV
jgi:Glycosyltransferase family 87